MMKWQADALLPPVRSRPVYAIRGTYYRSTLSLAQHVVQHVSLTCVALIIVCTYQACLTCIDADTALG